MSEPTPRLRMFAGPNGSGKSTLRLFLPKELLAYLNPDELEQEMRREGFLDFKCYGVTTTADEVIGFYKQSPLLISTGLDGVGDHIAYADGRLDFRKVVIDSYLAAVAGDFLRQKFLELKISFTFETVMSHRSKVELLAKARDVGYRTYLYFTATEAGYGRVMRLVPVSQLTFGKVPALTSYIGSKQRSDPFAFADICVSLSASQPHVLYATSSKVFWSNANIRICTMGESAPIISASHFTVMIQIKRPSSVVWYAPIGKYTFWSFACFKTSSSAFRSESESSFCAFALAIKLAENAANRPSILS